jgi:hypothetical protein
LRVAYERDGDPSHVRAIGQVRTDVFSTMKAASP